MINNATESESIILENIYDSVEQKTMLRQRDLAQIAGISLGMTNSILRRMAQKGWITIKKLNHRNIQYAVTIDGINEIIHRSYNYFKRTIKNVVYYKDLLDSIIRKACQNNTNAVILIGTSDLDFIVEHACHRYGISFLKAAGQEIIRKKTGNALYIYSETINDMSGKKNENALYLSNLVLRQGIYLR
jgi:predicted transcriptional regulator